MAKNNLKIKSKLVPEHCLALQKLPTLNPIAGIVQVGDYVLVRQTEAIVRLLLKS